MEGLTHTLAKLRYDTGKNVAFSMLVRDHFVNQPKQDDIRTMVRGMCAVEKRVADDIWALNGGNVRIGGEVFDIGKLKNVKNVIEGCN
jgi:fructose/tagatose bisphosphate aldolase